MKNPIFNIPGPLDGVEWDEEQKYFKSKKMKKSLILQDRIKLLSLHILCPAIVYTKTGQIKGQLTDIGFNPTGLNPTLHGPYTRLTMDGVTSLLSSPDSTAILVTPLGKITLEHAIVLTEFFNCAGDPERTKVRFKKNDENPIGFAQVYYIHSDEEKTEKVLLNLGSDGDISICSGNSYFENIQRALDQLREWNYAVSYKNWSVKELEEFGIYKFIE